MNEFSARGAGNVTAPPEADIEARRYRVISGCVGCVSDLTPLRRVPGVRDVRVLAATGTLVIEVPRTQDDGVLLRTASASGFNIEPVTPIREAARGRPRSRARWWLRPELVLLAIAAILLVYVEITACLHQHQAVAKGFAFATVAVGIIYPLRNALITLRNGRVTINVLLVIVVAGAIPLGRVVDAACVVVVFSLGVVLESFVADRARKSIQKLMDLSPAAAERFGPEGAIESVPVDQLQVGDVVLVRPGVRLPTDGTVVAGASWIDSSAITGESMPVEVSPGASVHGGTLNGYAALRVEVSKPFQDTVLARIIREVEEAQRHRGRAQRFADKFGNVYTPAVIALAVAMVALGPVVFGIGFKSALYRALVVLIVSCSCSLVLSVPVSVVSAIARAARDGVLIKGGAYLEQLAKIRALAFDKTGTLTLGRVVLVEVHALNGIDERELLRLAAAVESGATHPIADAVVRAARDRSIPVQPASDVAIVPGVGAEATVDGRKITVGRVEDLGSDETAREVLAAIEDAGATPVGIRAAGHLIGMMGVADQLRPDAVGTIKKLAELGITHTTMLTGDHERVARAIAAQVGIESVRAGLMPEEKSEAIVAIKEQMGPTGMVGDGVNDAPALATADVSIVMGAAGTDIALETADVALMADDLTKLPYAISLARSAQRIITQNVVLSLAAVALLIVAAILGQFTLTEGVIINEAWALVIIANGLRLLRPRIPARASGQAVSAGLTTSVEDADLASDELASATGSCCGDDCGCSSNNSTTSTPELLQIAIEPITAAPAAGGTCGTGECGCLPADAAAEASRTATSD